MAEATGVAKVEESIRVILGTQPGERLMRPQFGANLRSLVFAPNNSATAGLAAHYVREALNRWEPRIEVLDVVAENDQTAAALVINVHYRLRATAQEQVLTYPLALDDPR
nr:GPW/gp25 family protein [Kineosporia babensis]